MSLTKLLQSSVLMLLAWCGSASANTSYNLADFAFSGATTFTASVTTNMTGSFTDALEIENILNSSTYSAALLSDAALVSQMDNTNNAIWDLMLNEADSATLTIDATRMTLSFSTSATEIGSGVLLLRSSDMRSVLQFRQENNVTDYNFVDYTFDAIVSANAPIAYQSPFVFAAVTSVPEPSAAWLVLSGLSMIWLRRKGMQ